MLSRCHAFPQSCVNWRVSLCFLLMPLFYVWLIKQPLCANSTKKNIEAKKATRRKSGKIATKRKHHDGLTKHLPH